MDQLRVFDIVIITGFFTTMGVLFSALFLGTIAKLITGIEELQSEKYKLHDLSYEIKKINDRYERIKNSQDTSSSTN